MKRKTQQTGNPSTAYLEAAFNSGFFYHHQRFPHSRKRRRGKWLSLSLSLTPIIFNTCFLLLSLFGLDVLCTGYSSSSFSLDGLGWVVCGGGEKTAVFFFQQKIPRGLLLQVYYEYKKGLFIDVDGVRAPSVSCLSSLYILLSGLALVVEDAPGGRG